MFQIENLWNSWVKKNLLSSYQNISKVPSFLKAATTKKNASRSILRCLATMHCDNPLQILTSISRERFFIAIIFVNYFLK